MNSKKLFACLFAFLIVMAGAAEIAARVSGAVDFPLYDADSKIGYIPKASQQGSFLNSHAWRFNSLHMGAAEFAPGAKRNILLVGDSIVLGGNPVDEENRLGPEFERALGNGTKVWPISAGSWALLNELEWIRENQETVDAMSEIVFVVNSGDFADASSWSCELTHPRQKPFSAAWYLFKKYVYSMGECSKAVPPGLAVPKRDLDLELTKFLTKSGAKTVFFLYPDKAETEDGSRLYSDFSAGIELLKKHGANVSDKLFAANGWSTSDYRDDIHPKALSNSKLAAAMHSWLQMDHRARSAE